MAANKDPLEEVGYILDLVKPGMTVKFIGGQYVIQMLTEDPEAVRALAEDFLIRVGWQKR